MLYSIQLAQMRWESPYECVLSSDLVVLTEINGSDTGQIDKREGGPAAQFVLAMRYVARFENIFTAHTPVRPVCSCTQQAHRSTRET
jgi:hypothetical protein